MRERKTVQVEHLRNMVNAHLASEHSTFEQRKAFTLLLSEVLMYANRYRGFRYIDDYQDVEDYRHHYY